MLYATYIPDEDVLPIFCAPNLGCAGFVPRPLPKDKGLALVVGGGAAMAAHGSASSFTTAGFSGFVADFGGGAAIELQRSSTSLCDDFGAVLGTGADIEPQRSSSSAFNAFTVGWVRDGFTVAEKKQQKNKVLMIEDFLTLYAYHLM